MKLSYQSRYQSHPGFLTDFNGLKLYGLVITPLFDGMTAQRSGGGGGEASPPPCWHKRYPICIPLIECVGRYPFRISWTPLAQTRLFRLSPWTQNYFPWLCPSVAVIYYRLFQAPAFSSYFSFPMKVWNGDVWSCWTMFSRPTVFTRISAALSPSKRRIWDKKS